MMSTNENSAITSPSESKPCSKCNKRKPRTEFYPRPDRKSGVVSWCKSCKSKSSGEYRSINRDKLNVDSRRRYHADRDNRKAKTRADYHKNVYQRREHDRVRSGTPKRMEQRAGAQARRQGKIAAQRGTVTLGLYDLISIQAAVCFYCVEKFNHSDRSPTVDHIIPISRDGRHDDSNLVAACSYCNDSKGAKTGDEFVQYRRTEGLAPRIGPMKGENNKNGG